MTRVADLSILPVRAMLLCAAVVLAGCGGGGGSGGGDSTVEAPTASPDAVTAAVVIDSPAATVMAPAEMAEAEAATGTALPDTVGNAVPVVAAEPAVVVAAATVVDVPVAAAEPAVVAADPPVVVPVAAAEILPAVAPGPGYFVDAVAGNDSGAGSFAQPWKTLAKLHGARLRTGEGMYLRCGRTWRETLSLTATQLVDSSIVAGYGNCTTAKATISGADDFSGSWSRSGNVWSRPVPTATPKIARLFVEGAAMRIAQWPNADAGRKLRGFALTHPTTAPANAATTIVATAADRSVLAGKDIVGAVLQIRHGGAQVDANSVKAFDSATGALTLNASATFSVRVGNGYLLQDKRWMVDAAGEFHHDQAGGMLYVWPATAAAQADLNSALVEGAVRDVGLQVSNVPRLAVSQIAGVKTRRSGLFVYNAAAAVVRDVEASDNLRSGLLIVSNGATTGSSGSSVQSSSFLRNLVYGIEAFGLRDGVLATNTVADTGVTAFVGQSAAGIFSGPGTLVENNVVRNSALTGIRFDGAGGSTVQNNLVTDSCVMSSDCAGIYTWNGPKRADSGANQRSRVQGNTVVRAPVNLEGADAAAPQFNAGIYLDVFTESCTVTSNTVLDLPVGVYLHNASRNLVDMNTIALASQAALWAYMNEPVGDYMSDNTFSSNRIVLANMATGTFPATPVPSRAEAIWFWHKTLGRASIASGSNVFTGNDIVQLDDAGISVAWLREPGGDVHMTGAGWNRLNPLDAAPRTPLAFALHTFTLDATELVTNGSFDDSLGNWRSYFSTAGGSSGSVGHGSVQGCSGGCAVFAAQTLHDTIISPSFSLKAGSMYRVGFRASLTSAGIISKPGFVRDGAGSGAVVSGFTSATGGYGVAGQTIAYEGFFTAASTDPSTLRLAASSGARAGFDAVSLREVTGMSLSKTSDWAGYAYAGAQPVNVGCAALGWPAGCTASDADGAPVALPVAVSPYSAKLLLRSDSAWRVR